MSQINLSRWLKCIFVIVGICGVIAYVITPMFGDYMRNMYPEFSNRYVPWLIFIWASGVPCVLALVLAWKIATNIGKDQPFSFDNAKFLKWISVLSGGDAGFIFIGNVLFLLLDLSHFGVILASFVVVFVGIAISIITALLSYLVDKAATLQEQSNLTI